MQSGLNVPFCFCCCSIYTVIKLLIKWLIDNSERSTAWLTADNWIKRMQKIIFNEIKAATNRNVNWHFRYPRWWGHVTSPILNAVVASTDRVYTLSWPAKQPTVRLRHRLQVMAHSGFSEPEQFPRSRTLAPAHPRAIENGSVWVDIMAVFIKYVLQLTDPCPSWTRSHKANASSQINFLSLLHSNTT